MGLEQENVLQLWYWFRLLLYVIDWLMFVVFEYINGQEVNLYLIMGDLEVCCEGLEQIICILEEGGFERWFVFFVMIFLQVCGFGCLVLFIYIIKGVGYLVKLEERVFYSSLSDLFYYLYKWLFCYKVDFCFFVFLSIVDEWVLQGNLVYWFFEELLK